MIGNILHKNALMDTARRVFQCELTHKVINMSICERLKFVLDKLDLTRLTPTQISRFKCECREPYSSVYQ